MANAKISQLPVASELTGLEQFPIVQAGETVKTDTKEIKKFVKTQTFSLEVGTQAQAAGVSKLNGVTFDIGGVEYDVYNLKCVTSLTPEATAHVVAIGSIEVGTGNIFFISNRSNVESVDFNGFGGYANNPLNFGAMVDDSTDIARPLSGVFYVNQENIPTFPIEFNAMYIVAADAANFECDVYIDMDFIVDKGTSVEFTIA
jgi:hypothetical protein|tara:strand:- start:759 stop:1364 length:606 start_codon:yes stop_codon:yes gene_type:complete